MRRRKGGGTATGRRCGLGGAEIMRGGNKAKALQAGSTLHGAKAILHLVAVSQMLSRNSKAKRARSSGASDRERMQAGKGT